MFETLKFTVGSGRHRIDGVAVLVGKHVTVTIGGGDVPHVGAVALAYPRPSLKKDGHISASASVICGMGHKDDLPARETALRLAAKLNTAVAVSVGLHMDNPVPEDFTVLMDLFTELVKNIEAALVPYYQVKEN